MLNNYYIYIYIFRIIFFRKRRDLDNIMKRTRYKIGDYVIVDGLRGNFRVFSDPLSLGDELYYPIEYGIDFVNQQFISERRLKFYINKY